MMQASAMTTKIYMLIIILIALLRETTYWFIYLLAFIFNLLLVELAKCAATFLAFVFPTRLLTKNYTIIK